VADPALSLRSSSFAAQQADEIAGFIQRVYSGNRSTITKVRGRRPRFHAHVGAVADVSCTRVRSSIDFRVAAQRFDSFVSFAVRQGRILIDSGHDVGAGAGQVGLSPIGAPVNSRAEDLDVDLLQLSLARLDRTAGEIAGLAPGRLRFHAVAPVSAAMSQYWWSLVALLGGAARAVDSPMNSPLVAEEMIRAAAVGALHVFPNTIMTLEHRPGPGRVGPAALRRAVAFIDANADRAISLSDLAAAAGTGSRALQYAFRRHHGTTPLGYARRARLDRAHQALQAADPARGDTVAAIAARWGFAKPDRFAVYYRDAYGTYPSHTLRH
jgi:AraC-like DNA-binding protein